MILVADSGSTKTNWIAINEKGETYFKIDTDGLNPAVFTKKTLYDRIITKEELRDIKDEVKEIYFYGAGCGTDRMKNFLKKIL